MTPFLWRQLEQNCFAGEAGTLQVRCSPPRGLQLDTNNLHLPGVLGVEVISAAGLRSQTLASAETLPEVIIRQDTLLVRYAPSKERNVECDIRWRVLPEGAVDLEVSTLTPGKWDGLAVQTLTQLPAGEVLLLGESSPPILVYRLAGGVISYVEFCHPQDGVGIQQGPLGDGGTAIRYRLFGHDLEKGVILRGRLRGLLVSRVADVAAAQAAYQRFLAELPNLSL